MRAESLFMPYIHVLYILYQHALHDPLAQALLHAQRPLFCLQMLDGHLDVSHASVRDQGEQKRHARRTSSPDRPAATAISRLTPLKVSEWHGMHAVQRGPTRIAHTRAPAVRDSRSIRRITNSHDIVVSSLSEVQSHEWSLISARHIVNRQESRDEQVRCAQRPRISFDRVWLRTDSLHGCVPPTGVPWSIPHACVRGARASSVLF